MESEPKSKPEKPTGPGRRFDPRQAPREEAPEVTGPPKAVPIQRPGSPSLYEKLKGPKPPPGG